MPAPDEAERPAPPPQPAVDPGAASRPAGADPGGASLPAASDPANDPGTEPAGQSLLDLRAVELGHASLGGLLVLCSGVTAMANLYAGHRYWAMPAPAFLLASAIPFGLYVGLIHRLEAVRIGEQVLLGVGMCGLTVWLALDFASGSVGRPEKAVVGIAFAWILGVQTIRVLRRPAVRAEFARPRSRASIAQEVEATTRNVVTGLASYVIVVGLTVAIAMTIVGSYQPDHRAPIWWVVLYFLLTLGGSCGGALLTFVAGAWIYRRLRDR